MDTTILEKDITEVLGLDALPPEEYAEALHRIGTLIMKNVVTRVLVGLSDEDADALDMFMASGPNMDAIIAYLKRKEPKLDEIVAEEIVAFKEDSAAIAEKIQKNV